MNEDWRRSDVVSVVAEDFEVENWFGAGSGDDRTDRNGHVVREEMLAGAESVGSDEFVAVFAPKGVVGGRADRFIVAIDEEVEDVSGLMSERAGDGAIAGRSWLQRRARADVENVGFAFDAALGDVDFDSTANAGAVLGKPIQRTQKFDVGARAVSLPRSQDQVSPSLGNDSIAQRGVMISAKFVGQHREAHSILNDRANARLDRRRA